MYSLSCSCQDDSHNQKYVMFLAQFLNLVLFHVHYIKFTKLQLLLVHCLLPYLELAAKVLLYWRMWHSFIEIASNQNIEDGLLYQIFRLKEKKKLVLYWTNRWFILVALSGLYCCNACSKKLTIKHNRSSLEVMLGSGNDSLCSKWLSIPSFLFLVSNLWTLHPLAFPN